MAKGVRNAIDPKNPITTGKPNPKGVRNLISKGNPTPKPKGK